MTDVIRVAADNPDPVAIARAAACLRDGGLVAFPTETVYGLGVNALSRPAVQRLFAAKQRPAHDPLIVHVGSIDLLGPLVDWVEHGKAPDRPLASRADGSATVPLCPHPAYPHYAGGDPARAESYECRSAGSS